MESLQEKLARTIWNRRQVLKMSQEQLAEKIDKSTGFIGQLERGESLPSLETLQNLIHCLGIDASALFSDTQPSPDDTREILALMAQMSPAKREFLLKFARLLHSESI